MKKPDKQTRNTILIVALLLTIISCLVSFYASQRLSRLQKSLEEERYYRITAEEQLQKTNTKVLSVESQLATARSKLAGIQEILVQDKAIQDSLQSQLQVISKEKELVEKKFNALSEKTP